MAAAMLVRRSRPVREHLCAGLDYQAKLARFLENHDEPRAAATFAPPVLDVLPWSYHVFEMNST